MIAKIPKIAGAILLFAFTVFGCQLQEQPKNQTDSPQVAEFDPFECRAGETHWFDLIPINPAGSSNPQANGANFAYSLDVSDNPYTASDCLCEVNYFEFTFSEPLDDKNSLLIVNQVGAEVAYTQIDPVTIRVYGAYQSTELYITILDTNWDGYISNAGGLCIIDNIAGLVLPIDFQITRYEPLKIVITPPVPAIEKMYIPAAMTSPY